VYISDLRDTHREPVKVLALLDVTQVDVLEDYQLLIVLSGEFCTALFWEVPPNRRSFLCNPSERQVITFPLDALDRNDPMAGLKRAKRISSHTSFFKAGFCLDRVLVCIVKSSQLSSTFKTLEPIDTNTRGRAKPTFKKLLQGGNDTLKIFRVCNANLFSGCVEPDHHFRSSISRWSPHPSTISKPNSASAARRALRLWI
jgi:RHO1 GDP-GTP exchange protein 1/2